MTIAYDDLAERLAFGLPDRLSKALEVGGVSVGDMAEYLGVSPRTIGNYTSGKTVPALGLRRLWATRTGVPLKWIEDGTLDEAPPGPDAPVTPLYPRVHTSTPPNTGETDLSTQHRFGRTSQSREAA